MYEFTCDSPVPYIRFDLFPVNLYSGNPVAYSLLYFRKEVGCTRFLLPTSPTQTNNIAAHANVSSSWACKKTYQVKFEVTTRPCPRLLVVNLNVPLNTTSPSHNLACDVPYVVARLRPFRTYLTNVYRSSLYEPNLIFFCDI